MASLSEPVSSVGKNELIDIYKVSLPNQLKNVNKHWDLKNIDKS